MSIRPKCDRCKDELMEMGSIILSPPDGDGLVKKLHLCVVCWGVFEKWLFKKQRQHNYRACKDANCSGCQALVDHGLVMACDRCGKPGSTESDGWTLLNSGSTLCNACADKPDAICDTPGCLNHIVEDGVGPKALLCSKCDPNLLL